MLKKILGIFPSPHRTPPTSNIRKMQSQMQKPIRTSYPKHTQTHLIFAPSQAPLYHHHVRFSLACCDAFSRSNGGAKPVSIARRVLWMHLSRSPRPRTPSPRPRRTANRRPHMTRTTPWSISAETTESTNAPRMMTMMMTMMHYYIDVTHQAAEIIEWCAECVKMQGGCILTASCAATAIATFN